VAGVAAAIGAEFGANRARWCLAEGQGDDDKNVAKSVLALIGSVGPSFWRQWEMASGFSSTLRFVCTRVGWGLGVGGLGFYMTVQGPLVMKSHSG